MKSKDGSATAIVATLLVVAVIVWQMAAQSNLINGQLLGSPAGIYKSAVIGLSQGQLLYDTWVTLVETLLGLLLGSGLGIALGLALWFYPRTSAIVEQFSILLNSIPKVALAPLFVMWLGVGIEPKIAIALMIAVFSIVIDTILGLRSVDPDMLSLAKASRASQWHILFKIRLPNALPSMFAGMKVGIAFALVGAIVGEFVAGQVGLGAVIMQAQGSFDSARALARSNDFAYSKQDRTPCVSIML